MLPESEIRRLAGFMLQELQGLKLTVIAIPDGRPNSYRKVRAVVCPNPDWYSRLCQQYLRQRRARWKRPRTIIKRCDVLTALTEIAAGRLKPDQEYHRRMLDAIEWRHENRGDLAEMGGV